MNGREIPGFSWDPEKKKYFRIQANHVAPAGSQHSEQAVKKRKKESEAQKHRELRARRIRLQRVRKSQLLANPINRLGSEIGNDLLRGFVKQAHQGRSFVSQLELQHGYDFKKLAPHGTVVDFARYDGNGALLVGMNDIHSCGLVVSPPFTCQKQGKVSKASKNSAKISFSGRLSSLSLSESGTFLATVDSTMDGDSMLVTGVVGNLRMDDAPIFRGDLSPEKIKHHATLWCSAARPGAGNETMFAVGTSEGLYTLHSSHQCDFSLIRADISLPGQRQKGLDGVDLLSVDWLSPTVIAAGFRNSSLGLYDLRSRGFAIRIQHPQSLGKIKRVDENRLLVTGFHSMQMYDLRYPSRRGVLKNSCLVFEDYNNEYRHQIDVDCGLGLVASVTDNQAIRFNSLADGSSISTPRSLKGNMRQLSRFFFENPQDVSRWGQQPRLLVAGGGVVEEWAW